MAHKSAEPGRLQRGKLTVARDRGEKYAAPPIDDAWEPLEPLLGPRPAVSRGSAHELLINRAARL
jgi:hypothetical protein